MAKGMLSQEEIDALLSGSMDTDQNDQLRIVVAKHGSSHLLTAIRATPSPERDGRASQRA